MIGQYFSSENNLNATKKQIGEFNIYYYVSFNAILHSSSTAKSFYRTYKISYNQSRNGMASKILKAFIITKMDRLGGNLYLDGLLLVESRYLSTLSNETLVFQYLVACLDRENERVVKEQTSR